jgi:hypothetical protein
VINITNIAEIIIAVMPKALEFWDALIFVPQPWSYITFTPSLNNPY